MNKVLRLHAKLWRIIAIASLCVLAAFIAVTGIMALFFLDSMSIQALEVVERLYLWLPPICAALSIGGFRIWREGALRQIEVDAEELRKEEAHKKWEVAHQKTLAAKSKAKAARAWHQELQFRNGKEIGGE